MLLYVIGVLVLAYVLYDLGLQWIKRRSIPNDDHNSDHKEDDHYDHNKEREFLSKFSGGSVDLVKNEGNGIAIVTLNNPKRKNAVTGTMMVELADIVTELEQWSLGRGVILHGAQETFCSGADIKLMKSITEGTQGADMSRYMQETLTRLFRLPLVTVALIGGMSLGGGAELAVSCDFRTICSSASIGFVQVKLGLCPGWGGGIRLVQIVGRNTALKILASAKVMKSEEARIMGLVDLVVSDGPESLGQTINFLETLTSGGPAVIQATKKVILNATDVNYANILLQECNIFRKLFGGQDNLEALSKNIKFN